MSQQLTFLVAGQQVLYGGDRVTAVPSELADAFVAGDRLVVVQTDGALLHIPAAEHAIVDDAVAKAAAGFTELAQVPDEAIRLFFDRFAMLLESDATFEPIQAANASDIEAARAKGRSTTRLELSARMRSDMISGLRGWRDTDGARDAGLFTVDHEGWSVEARRAPLGVVGFVFEGRPNVFADACGVLRSGNAVVFRIGSDALGTARAIVTHALQPALAGAGLPAGAVQLVDSPSRSAGHALFSDGRLALAVARGSGAAVAQLGAVASQAGVPVSLHGTGGAWIVAGESAAADDVRAAVTHSLDRKVCNTLNCAVVLRRRVGDIVPAILEGLATASTARSAAGRLHVIEGSEQYVPDAMFDTVVSIDRAEGAVDEPMASRLGEAGLATEWEWENSPEMTLLVVDTIAEAAALFNAYSPHFVASMISDDAGEHDELWASVDAPFVGNGFTRWVDGQYALDKPELGLSNWEGGRMLGRGGILSGDSVHTVRYRATVTDSSTHR
ncbi:MAG: glutamate-5-semialdehyde dehydrogenase [Ilumatobacter sp.]|jgi:glutamate-5-semialdehyde dehydrogenase